jgi:hypothetical protein
MPSTKKRDHRPSVRSSPPRRRPGRVRTLSADEALAKYGLTKEQLDEAVRGGLLHPVWIPK